MKTLLNVNFWWKAINWETSSEETFNKSNPQAGECMDYSLTELSRPSLGERRVEHASWPTDWMRKVLCSKGTQEVFNWQGWGSRIRLGNDLVNSSISLEEERIKNILRASASEILSMKCLARGLCAVVSFLRLSYPADCPAVYLNPEQRPENKRLWPGMRWMKGGLQKGMTAVLLGYKDSCGQCCNRMPPENTQSL